MSFNIRYDNTEDKVNNWLDRRFSVKALIHKYKPDIVGLQEVLHHQKLYLDEQLVKYASYGKGRDDGEERGEYCPIYFDSNKFSMIHGNVFWLSDTPARPSNGWDASLPRICTYVHLKHKISNEEIHVFNMHLDHKGKNSREKSAALVLERISKLVNANKRVILMGDFNDHPKSKTIGLLKAVLDDALDGDDIELIGPLSSYNGFNEDSVGGERIDYILTYGLQSIKYRHLTERRTERLFISDHFAVLLDAKWHDG